MNRLVSLLILVCAAAAAFAQGALPPGYARLMRPPGTAMFHTTVGLCEDYPEESTTIEGIRADMAALKRAGVTVLRIAFGWDGIEGAKGKFRYGFWDDYVRIAVQENGITLIPYVCYTPTWNSTGDTSNYWNHTPKDYDEFGVFVGELVNRYKPWIRTWELWNEPDIHEFWSGNAADLARLTKIGAAAVRKADPGAKIVLAGLAGHTDFTLKLFRDEGISPYVDVVNCHSYYETWNGDPLEAVVPYVNTIADIIARYGNGQSLWMAEVGYSTLRLEGGVISDSYHATYAYEHTPPFQAVAMWRTLTLLLSTGKMAAIAWYRINDLAPGENVIGDHNNWYLGVDFLKHAPKPAEKALAFFNSFFAQKCRPVDAETRVLRSLASASEIHAFKMEDSSVAVVGWLKTHVRGTPLPPGAGTLADTRAEEVDVTLPMATASAAAAFDELGNAVPFAGLERSAGAVVLRHVSLRGGGIAIIKVTP
ncbi:MAG TPA: cellulase family glycosylhydrolase [Bacteroidota bacterium]|nr:cellulase family glycosylhydrolase [Bacteroidota bacterium]